MAVELLPEWETSLNIPSVFPRLSTTAQRQTAITTLLSKTPVINIQPYALGTCVVNTGTGLVTVTLTTSLLLSNQTSVTVTNCANIQLNGTFNITVLNTKQFTYNIPNPPVVIISTNSGAVLITGTGYVLEAPMVGIINDAGNYAFNFTNAYNTYEQFVYNVTGIKIHIYFNPVSGTNTFPLIFSSNGIIFAFTYNQALLQFNILVVGSSLPASAISNLNIALGHVIPTVCNWVYAGLVSS